MRYPDRVTMCVSSQAGCGMNCPFCATGQAGLTRNMSTAEIVDQVVAGARMLRPRRGRRRSRRRVSNVVFMGMGEPLANYKAVIGAVRRLTDPAPDGLGHVAARHHRVDRRPGARRWTGSPTRACRSPSRCPCTPPTTSCATPSCPSTPAGRSPRCSTPRGATPTRTGRRVSIEYALIRDINDQAWRADLLGTSCCARPRLGARQPDPAEPDARLASGRRRRPTDERDVRRRLRGARGADDGPRHPRPGDRRRLRPARGGDPGRWPRCDATTGSRASAGCARATTAGRSTRSWTTSRCRCGGVFRRRRPPRYAGRVRAGAPRLRRRRRSTRTSTCWRNGCSPPRRATGGGRRGRTDPDSEAAVPARRARRAVHAPVPAGRLLAPRLRPSTTSTSSSTACSSADASTATAEDRS